jgi:MGT family glycosyltransferase
MTTRYLFALTDGGGTVPPELGAVQRLVARGHAVTVLGEDTMANDIAATGASFLPWRHALNRASRRPEAAPYREWEIRSPRRAVQQALEHLVVRPAAGYAEDVSSAIRDHRPDLLVTSFFAIGAMIAAEGEGLAFVVMHPNINPMPAEGIPPFGPGLQPARGAVGRLRDRIVGAFSERLWDSTTLVEVNRLRAQYALVPVHHLADQMLRARAHLLLTSAAFDFPGQVPAEIRYVGPILDDPAWSSSAAWQPPEGDDPLVLVSMSSTFQDQAGCLQRVIDALARMPVRGLVTTGPALDSHTLVARPNVQVVEAAPHGQVLAHADLVICHGGHGTLMKAFAADLPVLVMPHGRDQADNAARVTYHRAGLTLPRTASPGRIAHTATKLIQDPSYQQAASTLGRVIRRDAASDALIQTLEDLPRTSQRMRYG